MRPLFGIRGRVYLLLLLCSVLLLASACSRSAVGEEVPQPIAFSHKAHADEGLECERCHRGAEREADAGLVALATCASCHRRVIPDHPEVAKVLAAYAADEPIAWRKVHHLPEKSMVHFHHGIHTKAGVECRACHGDVAEMTVAEAVVDVAKMGWCIDCHREEEASVDCLACHF